MQYLQQGTTLQQGRYRIESVIGSDETTVTYKATDVEMGDIVTIKELFPKSLMERTSGSGAVRLSDSASVERFQRQKEMFKQEAVQLRRSNAVRVYEMFEENGTVYYVTDSSDGIEHEETKVSQASSADESTVMAQSPSVDESTKLSSKAGSEQTRYASSSMNEETIASSQNYNNSSSGSGNRESYNYVPPQSSKSKNLLALIIVVGVCGIAALILLNGGCGNSYQPSPDDVDTNFVEPVDTIVDVDLSADTMAVDTFAAEPVAKEEYSEEVPQRPTIAITDYIWGYWFQPHDATHEIEFGTDGFSHYPNNEEMREDGDFEIRNGRIILTYENGKTDYLDYTWDAKTSSYYLSKNYNPRTGDFDYYFVNLQ